MIRIVKFWYWIIGVKVRKVMPKCIHTYWGQCRFTNVGICYDCNENFYLTTEFKEIEKL